MSKFQDVFEANCELSEDECVLAIHQAADGELTIKEAQSEYRTLATDAGMIKSPTQKKDEFITAITDLDMSEKEDVTAAKAIGADMEIGITTVTRYLKAKAVKDGVELAITVASRSNSMSAQLKSWFIENSAATNDEIVEKGIELGMTKISAKYYVPIYNTAIEIAKAITEEA